MGPADAVLAGGGVLLLLVAAAAWTRWSGGKQEKHAGKNALKASINRLGESSYYYAHKDRKWEGSRKTLGGAPPLLKRGTAAQTVPTSRKQLKSFGWADSRLFVEVFVNLHANGVPRASELRESDFSLLHQGSSLVLTVCEVFVLHIEPLFGTVRSARLKLPRSAKKAGNVKIVLEKSDEMEWTSLCRRKDK